MASHFVALLAFAAVLRPADSFSPGTRIVPLPQASPGYLRSCCIGRHIKIGKLLAVSGDENAENDESVPLSKEQMVTTPDTGSTPPSKEPMRAVDSLKNPPLPMLALGAVVVILVVSAIVGSFNGGDGGTTATSMAAGAGTLSGTAASGMTVSQVYDPRTFQPVCSASDQVYRYLQSSALVVVGKENYETYAPLIAGGMYAERKS